MITRRWTMKSDLDYYVKTGEKEPHILLKLKYKAPSGATSDVGTYGLDLVALAAKGVVTSRTTTDGEVFDIEIVKRRETFWLQVREGTSIPLDRFIKRGRSFDIEAPGVDFDALKERHLTRIADVLIGHAEEGSGGHTRLFDTLISDCMVFLGGSEAWSAQEGRGRYREHVVPCKVLRDTVAAMVADAGGGPGPDGFTDLTDDRRKAVRTDAVEMLRRRLGVVYLTQREADDLNKISGLKTGMPQGVDWDWKDDDQYLSRLDKVEGIKLVRYERAAVSGQGQQAVRKGEKDVPDDGKARERKVNGVAFVRKE